MNKNKKRRKKRRQNSQTLLKRCREPKLSQMRLHRMRKVGQRTGAQHNCLGGDETRTGEVGGMKFGKPPGIHTSAHKRLTQQLLPSVCLWKTGQHFLGAATKVTITHRHTKLVPYKYTNTQTSPILCSWGLNSSSSDLPKATLMTLFFPKKKLASEAEEKELYRLCDQWARRSFNFTLRMFSKETTYTKPYSSRHLWI